MMKKIWLYTAIFVLVSFVLFIYNEFNGNPISKYRAEKALQTYLKDMYGERNFRTDDGFYNFKFKEYTFTVIEIGTVTVEPEEEEKEGTSPREYEFTVRGFFKPTVSMDSIRISQFDHELMEQLSKQAAAEIYERLKKKLDNIHAVEVSLEVLKGQMEDGTSWSKKLSLDTPIDLYIVLDAKNCDDHDIYVAATEIQNVLNEENYDYSSVNINAKIFSAETMKDGVIQGYVKYAIGFDKNEIIKEKMVKEF